MKSNKHYKDYQAYLQHQIDGNKNQSKKDRADKVRQERIDCFKKVFEKLKLPKESKALFIGARWGEEVIAGQDLYAECIGMDLVPFPPLVEEGDMHELKYEDERFDFVYSNVIDHSYDMKKVFDEMGRVLKPGGLLLVDTHVGLAASWEALLIETDEDVTSCTEFELVEQTKIDKSEKVLFGLKDRFLFKKP